MKVFDAADIRNVALVGHSGAGKTQLAAALLYDTGATPRLGKVDEGTTVTDYDEEAIARKHTLSSSLAWFEFNKRKVNLIDTPGMGNFLSDARAALRVVEAAVVVVDGVSGVQVSTEQIWETAASLNLPRLIVVNRLDRERASLPRALDSLRQTLSRSAVAVHWPIGEEDAFTGIVDLVTMKAWTFAEDGSGKATEIPIPDSVRADVDGARATLVEAVAETDEALMERFFENGTLSQDDLTNGLAAAVRASHVFPVLCMSGLRNIGGPLLADAITALVPSPAVRPFPGVAPDGTDTSRAADPSAPLVVWVFKTIADQFAGRISLFRVISGTFKSDSTVQNLTRQAPERAGHLVALEGKTQAHVPEVHAGDLGAVAKLKDTHSGDILGDPKAGFTVHPLSFPEAVLSYAIVPKTRGDEDKISTSMHRLQDEDPSIGYTRDEQTHDLLLSGQGQMHIEVTVAKLRRRFGVEVELKPPHIPYRETIALPTEAHGRHKKQTGGHGQFGDCKIRVAPLPPGSGVEFEDDIFGGSIPRQFVPAVEKGVREACARGFLAGYPMVDLKVTVYDGSYHDVDSNEMSFKMAGRLAVRDAMTRAKPTLLEPVMAVEIYAPSDFAGDLMGDLNGRRGQIAGMDTRGANTVIRAQVPMSEMLTYEQTLTAATGGRGGYHMEFHHYAEVPGHLHAKIIAASKTDRTAEASDDEG
ncbi:MAG: elongation factor G [Acidobacteria bacterium]|jgi:elongation factor G|nr:elongation factor G [Acidobacteriota bacterium]